MNDNYRMKDYSGILKAKGPLVFLKPVPGIRSGEMLRIIGDGRERRAKVIRLEDHMTVAQVYEGTDGLDLDLVRIRYDGKPFTVELGKNMLGRTFNGCGEPIDGGGPFIGEEHRDINGRPINPMARVYPRNYIRTGISSIDILMTLIRGQKLPVFSGSGLPHRDLAAQIISQARINKDDEGKGPGDDFAVVFGAIGIKQSDARFFEKYFRSTGAGSRLVSYYNYANDPVSERISTPRCALTAAEYLAFDLGLHVLVVLMDMTSYAEGLREISSARDEVPGRKGYPGYLYSDLASLYERAGILDGHSGSVTMLPILTMPGDDISHPVADLTGFITEGQIVLGRQLSQNGVYPPVDILPSLSRLMKDGIGEGYTREDHSDAANQLFSAYAKVADIRNLAQIMGKDDLMPVDRTYLEFGDLVEKRFLTQRKDESRQLEESLGIAWDILSILPDEELDRLSEERIKDFIEPCRRRREAQARSEANAAAVNAASREAQTAKQIEKEVK